MSHNTWIHRTVRVAVRPLAAGPITPNQVTTLRLAVGLVAAAALATGTKPGAPGAPEFSFSVYFSIGPMASWRA